MPFLLGLLRALGQIAMPAAQVFIPLAIQEYFARMKAEREAKQKEKDKKESNIKDDA